MLKGMTKHEDKEHGKTLKHEAPRSINHKAIQNKNNTGTTVLQRSVALTIGMCVCKGGGGVKIFLTVDKLHPGSQCISYYKIHKKFGSHNVSLTQCMHHSEDPKSWNKDKYSWVNLSCEPEKTTSWTTAGQAKDKASSPNPLVKALRRDRHWVWGPNHRRAIKE